VVRVREIEVLINDMPLEKKPDDFELSASITTSVVSSRDSYKFVLTHLETV